MSKSDLEICFQLELNDFKLDVDVCLPGSGITAIFGQSGSGKTTLLRCIAGLHKASDARCFFAGDCWQQGSTFLATHKRPLAYVFQESSLFPHLTVLKNLEYGCKRVKPRVHREIFDHIVELLGLQTLLLRRPMSLSGGERQRVAIARALLLQPKLLLMDEPLASLDSQRKQEVLSYLEKVRDELNIPCLYVSHSIDEVARLADQVLVLEQGQVIRQGNVDDVLRFDGGLSLAQQQPFSLLYARVVTACDDQHLAILNVDGLLLRMPALDVGAGQELRLRLYAKDISICLDKPEHSSILNIIPCHITSIEEMNGEQSGSQRRVHLQWGQSHIWAQITTYSCRQLNLKADMLVYAQVKAVSVMQ